MSLVTKCDICGAIIDYDREKLQSTIRVFSDKHYHNPDTDNSFDLCPDCTKKLLEFVDVLKSGDRYVIWLDDANLFPKENTND